MGLNLPELEEQFNPWEEYEDYIYKIFLETVVNNKNLTFQGFPIRCKYLPADKNKHFSFWHIISEGLEEENRTPDLRRCERIRWIAWVINNVEYERISWWENRRGANTHIVILYEEEKYVVILAKRQNYYLLKSAYIISSDKRLERLKKERDNYWKHNNII